MKKIKTLFKRNDKFKVFNEIEEGCEWVNGNGVATRKFDGTAVMILNNELYKRYDVKEGKKIPDGFIPSQKKDETPNHWPGWIKCDRKDKGDKYHFEAFDKLLSLRNKLYNNLYTLDGTYELCGPKINGNPEGFNYHILVKHGIEELQDCPRTFKELKEYLKNKTIEGIVWHNKNGDMCKIKRRDFDYD